MADEDEALWAAGLGVIRVLRDRGHEAYLVGGCVRDRLLGRPVHDIDIATSALPEEVTGIFPRTVPTGLKHGTVTVVEGGRIFEVTTFRTESGYSDARRPDEVAFVDELREDLARRDFTINALAVDLNGEVVDLFDGRKDLADGIIRCVGDAGVRFGEDALRMLRAIRFAAEFGFDMTLTVWRGLRDQAERLGFVAMERVGSEWDRMMAGNDPDRACGLLLRSGLLACVKEPLPEAVVGRKTADMHWRPCEEFRTLGDIAESEVRWAAFIAQKGASPDEARLLCRTLRFSGKRETRIAAAVAFHRTVTMTPPDRSSFIMAILDFGRAAAVDWLEMTSLQHPYREWLTELTVTTIGQLAAKGDELARSVGKPAGPWVALLLRRLLEEVAHGRLPNEKDSLLRAAAELANSHNV
jgi:tRNA nucleotidyltransferase (CCA-adding enzyme)